MGQTFAKGNSKGEKRGEEVAGKGWGVASSLTGPLQKELSGAKKGLDVNKSSRAYELESQTGEKWGVPLLGETITGNCMAFVRKRRGETDPQPLLLQTKGGKDQASRMEGYSI